MTPFLQFAPFRRLLAATPSVPRSLARARNALVRSHSTQSAEPPPPLPPPFKGIPSFPDLVDQLPPPGAYNSTTPLALSEALPPTVLVTGATGGIGLEMLKGVLAAHASSAQKRTCFAVVRCAPQPTNNEGERYREFREVVAGYSSNNNSELKIVYNVDVSNFADVARVKASVEALSGTPNLDLLLNTVGILAPLPNPSSVKAPERQIADLDPDWLAESFKVNTIAPILLTRDLFPLMRKAKDPNPSLIIHLSARVGSLSDNELGGWHTYRLTKSALSK